MAIRAWDNRVMSTPEGRLGNHRHGRCQLSAMSGDQLDAVIVMV